MFCLCFKGKQDFVNALYEVGCTMDEVEPDYVVIGESKSYSLDTLTKQPISF